MLKENLTQVEEKIDAACRRAGRDRSEVTLIAVSKTKPVSTLKEAYDLGVRVFGENKVQELVEKYEKKYRQFAKIYPAVKGLFAQWAQEA